VLSEGGIIQFKGVTLLDSFRALELESFKGTCLPVKHTASLLKGTPEMSLVSIVAVNNETGVKQIMYESGMNCRESKTFFHTDAAQTVVNKASMNDNDMIISKSIPYYFKAGLDIREILDPGMNRVPIGVPSSGKEYIIPGMNKYHGILDDPILHIPSPIQDAPSHTSRPEKQAARLIVIRRIKMNKHKLRKLRKKMHYKWAKIKERRYIRKEKAYLDEKLGLIHAAMKFDAKDYVADVIRKAKEEPLPRKWTNPLMPDWYREQEMAKEARLKRYQKVVNMYLNKEIKIRMK